MPITLADSQLTIFTWSDRNEHLPHLTTKKPKKRHFEQEDYPYNCPFTDGYPACTITFNVFQNNQMVVLHIPCKTLFSLEAFRKSFDSRKVCPTCNGTINESDLDILSEKISRLIGILKDNLNSKRREEKKLQKSLARLNKTDEQETPVSLSKDQKKGSPESNFNHLVSKTPSPNRTSVMFTATLDALSQEILELEEKIQALEILEKRVIRENFYKPYIQKIKILALLIISVFLAKYCFGSTVTLCNDLH